MIKLRMHGEPEEINKFAEFLSKLSPWVRILNCSRNYADRGMSVYKRVYMDVELRTPTNPDEDFTNALTEGGQSNDGLSVLKV